MKNKKNKSKIKIITLFFVILIFLVVIPKRSLGSFGDLIINIKKDGKIDINGETDCKDLNNIKGSLKFTKIKNNKILINISSSCFFETLNYKIKLPEKSLLNYFKSTTRFIITTEKGRIIIKGSDANKKLNLLLQFSVISNKKQKIINYVLLITTITSTIGLTVLLIKQKKRKISNIKDDLNDRQKQIIEILLKKKKISQKELTNLLNIPKSSVSRNIKSLLRKGIIIREKKIKKSIIKLNNKMLQK